MAEKRQNILVLRKKFIKAKYPDRLLFIEIKKISAA